MAVTTDVLAPAADDPGPRRLTVEEFERIPDDLFPEGERTELIDGLIYTRMGQNDPHYFALLYTIEVLRAVFGTGFVVASRMPTRFASDSKVEPDVIVLRGRIEEFEKRRVEPRHDVVLLVEVSDATLARDRTIKARLYERNGIGEYWVVNARDRTLVVHRLSSGGTYEMTMLSEHESMSVNDTTVQVADLLLKTE